MSDATTTPEIPGVPEDFGAAIAEEFAKRGYEARPFDPNVSRGAADGANLNDAVPPGGWPEVDLKVIEGDGAGVTADSLVAPPTTPPVADPTVPAGEATQAGEPASVGVDGHQPVADTPPVPVGEPSGTGSGGGELPPPTPPADASTDATELPPPVQGYVWERTTSDGGTVAQRFTDQQVQNALMLHDWAQNLPADTRTAITAIEQGQAVAIPRADLDRFLAWQQQQQAKQPQLDLDDLDPEVVNVLRQQQAEIARLQQVEQQQTVTAPINANLDALNGRFVSATDQWKQSHNLTDDEFQTVMQSALDANLFRTLGESMSSFNPVTGQLITPANPEALAQRALDAALSWNASLHAAAASRVSSMPDPTTSPTVNPPAPTLDDLAVQSKRARAGSVAAAPSAAAPPPRTTLPTGQDLVNAMAAEIAKDWATN